MKWALTFLLCLATPSLAARSPCDGFTALRTAAALGADGTLTARQLDTLLLRVNPTEFSPEDWRVIEPLFQGARPNVQKFGNWTRLGMPFLRARLNYCLSPDLSKKIKGEVLTPRPGNGLFEAEDGAAVEDDAGFEMNVLAYSAAAGASFLGLLLAGIGPLARYMRRRRRRYLCALDVFLSSAAGAGDGVIMDISLVGAKIRKGNFQAEIGDKLQMSTDAFHNSAHVIWCNAHYLGVRFRHPLSREQVRRAVASKPKAGRSPSRIGESAQA